MPSNFTTTFLPRAINCAHQIKPMQAVGAEIAFTMAVNRANCQDPAHIGMPASERGRTWWRDDVYVGSASYKWFLPLRAWEITQSKYGFTGEWRELGEQTRERQAQKNRMDGSQVKRLRWGDRTIMTEGRVEGDGVIAAGPSVVVVLQFNRLNPNSVDLPTACVHSLSLTNSKQFRCYINHHPMSFWYHHITLAVNKHYASTCFDTYVM